MNIYDISCFCICLLLSRKTAKYDFVQTSIPADPRSSRNLPACL